jgi:MFS family permease
VARGRTPEQAAKATFRDVFAVAEFRALWLAQLLSIIGDQFARVALTVLVFDRTRSALLAAVTFVVSIVPAFVGGITLAWLADRYPRRTVMIVCDLARCALVLIMVIPGMPLAGMVALLFVVTLTGAPFLSARAAVYTDVFDGERYVLGTAITLTTLQFAQVLGFTVGGASVGFLGARASLVIDAATFATSALLVRGWVRSRPAPPASPPAGLTGLRPVKPAGLAAVVTGSRLVFASQVLRTTMLFGWLAAFYDAPEGVAAPLAQTLGGGAIVVGVILAAQALGQASGVIVFSRLVSPPARLRYLGPLAVATCAVLVLFAWRPSLLPSLLILFVSGLCASYQLAANAAFVGGTPPERRSQAFGLAQGGMSLGQGMVMILAGAAADQHSPALVIAVCGATGAALAVVLALSWLRDHDRPRARHKRALTAQVHCCAAVVRVSRGWCAGQPTAAVRASLMSSSFAAIHCTWASIPVSTWPARTRLAIIWSPRPSMYTAMTRASSAGTRATLA